MTTHQVGAGEHRTFGARYIHDLNNLGHQDAVSVHVYGPRLASMTYYDLGPEGRLGIIGTEAIPPLGPFDVTADHDPS